MARGVADQANRRLIGIRVLALVVMLLGLGMAYLLVQGHETERRVIRVERRAVDACVDNHPRPCRELLNRLLAYATPRQRRQFRREAAERARVLSSPKVEPPPESHSPRPKGRKPPSDRPGSPKPRPVQPDPPEAPPKTEPPRESPSPPPEPTLPPLPLPEPICQTVPALCR